ncbi:hypothetical protein TIFTF001_009324 [Ficus carica]|uniref:ZF-HD dimerization-type domain-containing protein n=1 Tax=Ficus carica TaxID=3494 RepID=A0AA88A6K8_FICCA|nr:hypothetical protein TIFTF001_009324 [Ficus carica]
MEFDEHDDPDEEMEIPTGPPGYDSSATAAARANKSEVIGGGGSSNARKNAGGQGAVRYRECLKNHAVNIGGQAVDGCCEFMAAGEEGSLDALKCAACNCHRNFHRKEIIPSSSATGAGAGPDSSSQDHHNYIYHHHPQHHHQSFPGYYRSPPPPPPSGYLHLRPLALPGVSGGGRDEGEDLVSNPSSSGGGGSSSKKRFRTKFTQEQKEKMLAFAESVGWRIQKHDETAVEQFCAETGVRRKVLKVWMHNNKHTLGKKP